jgi:hypothetical protein
VASAVDSRAGPVETARMTLHGLLTFALVYFIFVATPSLVVAEIPGTQLKMYVARAVKG